MIEVLLKDTIANKTETVLFYSEWNEIPKKHLLYIGEYWKTWQDLAKSNISLMKAKALLFVRFAKCKTVSRKNLVKKILETDNESMFELTELSNFIFTSNTLTVCPVPVVKKRFRKLYPPNNKLSNIVAAEFAFADAFYLQYDKSGDEKTLDKFLGCLYRPKKWFSSARKDFDKSNVGSYSKIMGRLKYAEKQIILLWYIGCRLAIIEANKNLFKQGGNEANDSGWIDVFLEMAGSKFGNFKETEQTEMFLIFKELQHSAKKAAEAKRNKA